MLMQMSLLLLSLPHTAGEAVVLQLFFAQDQEQDQGGRVSLQISTQSVKIN